MSGRIDMRAEEGLRQARWGLFLAGMVIVFAPLVRGGNRPLPLLALELASLPMLAWVLARPPMRPGLPRLLVASLLLLAMLPALQLVPLPWAALGLRTGLPPEVEGWAAAGAVALSQIPYQTEAAWLALLPPLAIFLVVVRLRGAEATRLVQIFLAVAAVEAVLALIQFGSGGEMLAALGIGTGGGSGEGTYANRNHLAGLMEMSLPIALALLASTAFRLDRESRSDGRRGHSLWWRLKSLGGQESQTMITAIYAAASIVLLLGLVFSRSRTGIALGMLGVLLVAVVLGRSLGRRFASRLAVVVVAGGGALAVAVGLAPVLARFSLDALGGDRFVMAGAALQAARHFLPFGSGAGTFVDVFRGFHPAEIGGDIYINHAHNDYAEWLMEGGVPAGLLILALVVCYVAQWRRLWGVRDWQSLHMLRAGAGVGLLLLALHGLTDYNLRIPANAIYFAFLAALFFHVGEEARRPGRREETRGDTRREPVVTDLAPPSAAVVAPLGMPASERVASAWEEAPSGDEAVPDSAQAEDASCAPADSRGRDAPCNPFAE